MNHNFRLWFELWFKLWFGVWLKLWPKIEESSMISLRGGGLVAAFFGARAGPGRRFAYVYPSGDNSRANPRFDRSSVIEPTPFRARRSLRR